MITYFNQTILLTCDDKHYSIGRPIFFKDKMPSTSEVPFKIIRVRVIQRDIVHQGPVLRQRSWVRARVGSKGARAQHRPRADVSRHWRRGHARQDGRQERA